MSYFADDTAWFGDYQIGDAGANVGNAGEPVLYENNGSSSSTNSDVVNQQGVGGIVPGITFDPQGSSTGGKSPYSAITDFLGTIRATVRDVGTVSGDIKRTITQSGKDFETAQKNAASGNKIGQLFQYSTPMEKTMLMVAIVGLGFAAYSTVKK